MLRAWFSALIFAPMLGAFAAMGCGAGGDPVSRDLGPGDGTGATSTSSGGSGNPGSGGGSGGTAPPPIMMRDGGAVDPCEAAGKEPGCETMAAPACGDGELNVDGEECDDGNTLPGDCCSGTCKIEKYCECDDP